MDELSAIEQLIDKKVLQVLLVFLEDDQKEFYLLEVSKQAKVAPASTYRIVNHLVKTGILELIQVNKFKLYKLKATRETDQLKGLLKKEAKTLDLFVNKISEIPGVQKIILHGQHTKEKADILIIGQDIDPSLVKSYTVEIKEKYGFTISSLSLTEEQYSQMANMGLYSGEKKTIFLRKKPET